LVDRQLTTIPTYEPALHFIRVRFRCLHNHPWTSSMALCLSMSWHIWIVVLAFLFWQPKRRLRGTSHVHANFKVPYLGTLREKRCFLLSSNARLLR
jgi:hypothetical protein